MLTVVTGAPCSGKSTYVREHAQPGDVVIDFDVIAQALGSPVAHDHGADHREVTFAARGAAIGAALGRVGAGARVWVVDWRPSPRRRAQYDAAGAVYVDLAADADVLHERASAGRPDRWHALIDEFLADQRPAAAGAKSQALIW